MRQPLSRLPGHIKKLRMAEQEVTAEDARIKLKSLASPSAAKLATRFFKTGPGQYGEGDTFIGISVPTLRRVSREFRTMPLDEIHSLLKSPIHEERHLALMILVIQVAKSDEAHRKRAYDLYLDNTNFINNWDLVDCSAPQVVGGFLMTQPREPLFTLAKSKILWERRIAIVSTQHFIRHGQFGDTLAITKLLLGDKEDLIHKATGWMLREVGKKDQSVLEAFLDQHGSVMPRTMLRYAIERFPLDQRQVYLQQKPPSGMGTADSRSGRRSTDRGAKTAKAVEPADIDGYISQFPATVQAILRNVREAIRRAAPDAEETISYQMPAFKQHGILVYFAAWKTHIGMYPPISGDKVIEKAITRYAGPKGNLQFPLDEPMPLDLIERIVSLRVKQCAAKAASSRKKK